MVLSKNLLNFSSKPFIYVHFPVNPSPMFMGLKLMKSARSIVILYLSESNTFYE